MASKVSSDHTGNYKLNEEGVAPQPKTSTLGVVLISGCIGIVFGTAFNKSHVFEPAIIRAQFLFSTNVMLKMFCGAMGMGMICLAVSSILLPVSFDMARDAYISTHSRRSLVYSISLGCFILGVGMAVGGACPGMVTAQLGAGVASAPVTFAGALFGAFVYGVFESRIAAALVHRGPHIVEVCGERHVGKSYVMVATAMGAVVLVGCVVLEVLVSWKADLPDRLQADLHSDKCAAASFNPITCPAWPPSIAGALLGLAQFAAVGLLQSTLGSSTAYAACTSMWVWAIGEQKQQTTFAYCNEMATPQRATWWQVPYLVVAILTNFMWSAITHDVGDAPGLDYASSFVGGALMLFGSRLAMGCTSGHGISGCSLLLLPSFCGTAAMFGGGIITAVVWHFAAGGYL